MLYVLCTTWRLACAWFAFVGVACVLSTMWRVMCVCVCVFRGCVACGLLGVRVCVCKLYIRVSVGAFVCVVVFDLLCALAN